MSFAIQGAICLAMCVPIAIPLAIVGVAVGRSAMSLSQPVRRTVTMLLVDLGYRPCYRCDGFLSERYLRAICCCDVGGGGCPTRSRLDECCRIFRASRPDRMDLSPGHRVSDLGADRCCEFSTGSFVEPITRWQQPTLLAFDVSATPAPMRELSPYDIHPPHLDGFLKSHRGQFRLAPLDGGTRTRLEGTTWCSHKLYPEFYWRLWSDMILHKIHRRVLDQIRALSEK